MRLVFISPLILIVGTLLIILLLTSRWMRWLSIVLVLLVVPVHVIYWLRSGEFHVQTARLVLPRATALPVDLAEPEDVVIEPAPSAKAVVATKAKAAKAGSKKAAAAERPEADRPAPDRPAWADAEDGDVGGTYEMTAHVGPFNTQQECNDQLDPIILQTVAQFAARTWPAAATAEVSPSVKVLQEYGLIAQRYLETVKTSFGPMRQLYVRLSFNAKVRDYLAVEVHNAVVRQRLGYAATGLAAVLGCLAVAWVGLRWKGR